MKHFAGENFWKLHDKLPTDVQRLADKNHELLKRDPYHPSLHIGKVGNYWSARVSSNHRVLAVEVEGD